MNLASLGKKLEELPSEIYSQNKKVLEAEKEYKLEELAFDVAFAQALVGSKRSNATEKKHEAVIETDKMKQDLIKQEWKLKKEEVYAKALNDQFTALRKLSSMEIEKMRSQISGH